MCQELTIRKTLVPDYFHPYGESQKGYNSESVFSPRKAVQSAPSREPCARVFHAPKFAPLTPSSHTSDGTANGSSSPFDQADFLVGSPYPEATGDSSEKAPVFLVDDSHWFLTATLQTILTGSQHGPFTLVGPTGSGKTTLTSAIVAAWQGNRSQANHEHPAGKPVVTTGADFARSYAHAVEADAIDDFRRRHRRAGLVVIDDLQGTREQAGAQQELRTMLDRLAVRGVTVVCTSSVPPLRDANLSPDLASRLAAGKSRRSRPLAMRFARSDESLRAAIATYAR